MNNRITFLVQGSSDEPYEVDFYKEDDKLKAFCTCMAGENRTHCKHRLSILAGSEKHIVSGNALELARRGYNLSKLRDTETTTGIINP